MSGWMIFLFVGKIALGNIVLFSFDGQGGKSM